MLHKETHEFKKSGTAYKLTATVHKARGINGTEFYIELKVIDLEPIVSEYEHVHTGEQVRNTYFETWGLQTDSFVSFELAKKWTAANLPRIKEQFNSGKNPRWEQEY